MEEIKFRGKNESGWHEGLLTFMFRSYAISHVEDENTVDLVDKTTIGQYMDLKDKNGKRYCQDDIVKYKWKVFRLIKGTYAFELQGFYDSSLDNPWDFFGEGLYLGAEIVGNIHDNPELLEKKELKKFNVIWKELRDLSVNIMAQDNQEAILKWENGDYKLNEIEAGDSDIFLARNGELFEIEEVLEK